jgi:hypothetical protein
MPVSEDIGMINRKTTAVRIIPAPGQAVHRQSSRDFVRRGGRFPAPIQALNN